MSVLPPSTFICTECGAVFTGTLNEAADAAFEHTAAHADEQRQAQYDEQPAGEMAN